MLLLRPAYSLLISILLIASSAWPAAAQSLLPQTAGERAQFDAMIEMPKGYVSGMCVIVHDGDQLKGCIFNEFGITALGFTYQLDKKKVKLNSVLPMLNKWYIKRTIKKDLKQVILALERGETSYVNERRHITYQFKPTAAIVDEQPIQEEPEYDLPQ